MPKNESSKKRSLSEPVTLKTLGEFTDEVILPGVEKIVEGVVDEKIEPLRQDIKAGFSDVSKSIRVLAGEIAELKVQKEEGRHEERILRLEEKAGVRGGK